jgi:hypothetical protein
MKTTQDILSQLDDCFSNYHFPILDNGYAYLAGTNLTAFCDKTRWAMIIETIGFNYRGGGHNGITNCLYVFGNCLTYSPGINNDNFLYLTEDSANSKTFDDEEEFYLNPESASFLLRNVETPIIHNRKSYLDRGIKLEDDQKINAFEFLRLLDSQHHDKLIATETEIRSRIPTDLPQIIQFRDWFHPDGEKPSDNDTFKQLALVLETENTNIYTPKHKPNTHWVNWPDSGTL